MGAILEKMKAAITGRSNRSSKASSRRGSYTSLHSNDSSTPFYKGDEKTSRLNSDESSTPAHFSFYNKDDEKWGNAHVEYPTTTPQKGESSAQGALRNIVTQSAQMGQAMQAAAHSANQFMAENPVIQKVTHGIHSANTAIADHNARKDLEKIAHDPELLNLPDNITTLNEKMSINHLLKLTNIQSPHIKEAVLKKLTAGEGTSKQIRRLLCKMPNLFEHSDDARKALERLKSDDLAGAHRYFKEATGRENIKTELQARAGVLLKELPVQDSSYPLSQLIAVNPNLIHDQHAHAIIQNTQSVNDLFNIHQSLKGTDQENHSVIQEAVTELAQQSGQRSFLSRMFTLSEQDPERNRETQLLKMQPQLINDPVFFGRAQTLDDDKKAVLMYVAADLAQSDPSLKDSENLQNLATQVAKNLSRYTDAQDIVTLLTIKRDLLNEPKVRKALIFQRECNTGRQENFSSNPALFAILSTCHTKNKEEALHTLNQSTPRRHLSEYDREQLNNKMKGLEDCITRLYAFDQSTRQAIQRAYIAVNP